MMWKCCLSAGPNGSYAHVLVFYGIPCDERCAVFYCWGFKSICREYNFWSSW